MYTVCQTRETCYYSPAIKIVHIMYSHYVISVSICVISTKQCTTTKLINFQSTCTIHQIQVGLEIAQQLTLQMVELRVDGTTSVDVDADLNRRRESMSATLWSSSARYGGAVECRQRYVSTASLKSIRCSNHDIT